MIRKQFIVFPGVAPLSPGPCASWVKILYTLCKDLGSRTPDQRSVK